MLHALLLLVMLIAVHFKGVRIVIRVTQMMMHVLSQGLCRRRVLLAASLR